MKRYINLLMGVLLVMMLAGCRKDLCYNHDEHSMTVKFNVVASWLCEWEDCGVHDWSQEWNFSWDPFLSVCLTCSVCSVSLPAFPPAFSPAFLFSGPQRLSSAG